MPRACGLSSHKEITVALAGCTTKAHVDDAVRAVEHLEEYPAEEIVKKYEDQGMALNDLCTGCAYCAGCPKGIEIPKLMDAYNHKILTGRPESMEARLNGHWGIKKEQANACIGCGKCERQCTQHLPIIQRMKEIAAG
ncbi:MAG: 4Fe-4S dicluster domain-containing protein [Lachnospiraceae bacterium]